VSLLPASFQLATHLLCSGLSGGFNFVLVLFLFKYYFALFFGLYVNCISYVIIGSQHGHVGYSGSLQ